MSSMTRGTRIARPCCRQVSSSFPGHTGARRAPRACSSPLPGRRMHAFADKGSRQGASRRSTRSRPTPDEPRRADRKAARRYNRALHLAYASRNGRAFRLHATASPRTCWRPTPISGCPGSAWPCQGEGCFRGRDPSRPRGCPGRCSPTSSAPSRRRCASSTIGLRGSGPCRPWPVEGHVPRPAAHRAAMSRVGRSKLAARKRGGHAKCGHQHIACNSCKNRHCPSR
ncbi:hypothetical protein PAA8504_02171 [Palleronia abyssalis]|uniref:Uncharacterized protein n=1 Tax=Palleronia abyssalis TaxID=1501240 RepID=A0A2R8BW31_9RHOB|nr:hypothetical protein PAA8504_02171 [Palleronia abyssalis]